MTFYRPKLFLITASVLFLASVSETLSYNLFPRIVEESSREFQKAKKNNKLSKTKITKAPRPAKKTKMLNKLKDDNIKTPKTNQAKKSRDPFVVQVGNATKALKAKDGKKVKDPFKGNHNITTANIKAGKKSKETSDFESEITLETVSEFGTPLKKMTDGKKSKDPFASTKAPNAIKMGKTSDFKAPKPQKTTKLSKAPRPSKTTKAPSLEKNKYFF